MTKQQNENNIPLSPQDTNQEQSTHAELEGTRFDYIKDLFSLRLDTDEAGTIDSIQKSIEFRGGNLWALIFAALIASIGLNTNSIAVIIGAMLISPLMGPIVGAGYAAGTNDFEMLKASLRNLALMVALALCASILYFMLSPLKEPTAELLARIRPNLYDVLIAVFGGAVGIVASSRKDRGNAIPGVAIATALMPPLCAAGYGIATGQFAFFLGAFYLFFINSVFIALASMVFVRVLQFPTKQFLDEEQGKRARILIGVLIAAATVPSLFTAVRVVREAVFMRRATAFVDENFAFSNTTILKPYNLRYDSDTSVIELILIGEPLAEQVVEMLQNRMGDERYQLGHTQLLLRQSNNVHSYYGNGIAQGIPSAMLETVVREKDKTIDYQRKRIAELETMGSNAASNGLSQQAMAALAKKLTAIFPQVKKFAYSEVARIDVASGVLELIPLFVAEVKGQLDEMSELRLREYLRVELEAERLELVLHYN